MKKARLRKIAAGDLAECTRLLGEYRKQLTIVATGLERLARGLEATKWRIDAAGEPSTDTPTAP